MDIPVSILLLALGGKTLLNWAMVLVLWRNMGRSFLGAFCVSLAVADALLFLSVSTIFLLGDVCVIGLRLTLYHVCALVHVACLAHSILHWPVLLLAGLDFHCTLSRWPYSLGCLRRYGYPLLACLLWAMALYHVLGGPSPTLELGPLGSDPLLQQCQVYRGSQSAQVCRAILALVSGALLLCFCGKFTLHGNGSGVSGRICLALYQSLLSFLSIWYAFVVLLVVLLLLKLEVPGFLDMNLPWLCFLNSFLICTVSIWRPPACPWEGDQAFPVFPDGFCDWCSLRKTPSEIEVSAIFLERDCSSLRKPGL
ncbi:hypothetical protein GJAV_G00084090 [Gymnothorax javanicus]|nr:hypothetical protein GJAV_G00084090 [Gymnothorax javanicus]